MHFIRVPAANGVGGPTEPCAVQSASPPQGREHHPPPQKPAMQSVSATQQAPGSRGESPGASGAQAPKGAASDPPPSGIAPSEPLPSAPHAATHRRSTHVLISMASPVPNDQYMVDSP